MAHPSPPGAGCDVARLTSESAPLELFWQGASDAARPRLEVIHIRMSDFSSPSLRVQRVSQLDAELLDSELASMLLEPLSLALANIRSNLPARMRPELLLVLRLVLFKLSVYDRGATYGAMLQNLKYRNERAHLGALQSTARDAPLSRTQLALHPLFTILAPYAHHRLESHVSSLRSADPPADDARRRFSGILDTIQRTHALAGLVNFVLFLSNGKYRTLTDRVLGMRLTYAHRSINRNVSFEFLNRQLVWHAFTEFLLFLLPLVKPKRVIRRLLRLPTHPWLLSLWIVLFPRFMHRPLGLYRDDTGRARWRGTWATSRTTTTDAQVSERSERLGEYWDLPPHVCAICWKRMERIAGVSGSHRNASVASSSAEINDAGQDRRLYEGTTASDGQEGYDSENQARSVRGETNALRAGIPRIDPLDPAKGLVAGAQKRRARDLGNGIFARHLEANIGERSSSSSATSSAGLAYADAAIHTAYAAKPCGCVYCYYCLVSTLLCEEAGEELLDSDSFAHLNHSEGDGKNARDQGTGAWICLRCGEKVCAASRIRSRDEQGTTGRVDRTFKDEDSDPDLSLSELDEYEDDDFAPD